MADLLQPPPGHPHFMSEEERQEALHQKTHPSLMYEPEIKEYQMSSAAASKYAALKAKMAEAKKQMEETAKSAFNEMSAELFATNPTLQSFGWTQYTPYWNDGDVCTFSAHTDYPTVSMTVGDEVFTFDSNRGDLTNEDGDEIRTADSYIRTFKSMKGVTSILEHGKTITYDPQTNTVTRDGVKVNSYEENSQMFDALEEVVSSFLGNFEAEDLETMFGDHMQITVHRDGKIETEEYQHD